MKILKTYPSIDKPNRYNYHVNYGVWDEIQGDSIILETLKLNQLDNYDVILLPMFKRWSNHMNLLNKIKEHKIKSVLFDNDSCYRTFENSFYIGLDYIFYRDVDKNGNVPKNGSWLPWSIDTDKYAPKYGGNGISFNCVVNHFYPLRQKIATIKKPTNHTNKQYIIHLQNSAAAIHTDNDIVPMVRAKALEFAACGTQIISNKTKLMDYFFPNELIVYFNTVGELSEIMKSFKPNIEIQKELRSIVETKHSNKIRANEVLIKMKNEL